MNEIDLMVEIPDSPNHEKDVKEIGFFKKNSCYWFQSIDRKGNKSNVRVSNFLIESLYNLVNGTNDSIRVMKLQRNTGEIDLIEVKSSELTNTNFETVLKSKRCTFKGDTFQLKTIFEYLMDKEKTALKITSLGFQPDSKCYAFADSIINKSGQVLKVNELGIVEDSENVFYLPAFSKSNINDDSYQNERQIIYKKGEIDFNRWAELTYKTFGSNGIIGIQYIILSLFRDIVYRELGFFPFLFLFGGFGTGKTSYVKNFLGLLGDIKDGIDLGNVTLAGVSREISQRINSFFYLKEFTTENADIANKIILTGYDGVGRATAESDNSNATKKHAPKSGIIFDGNYLPVQKDAVFSRLILLMFEGENFNQTQIENFNTLELCRKQGLSQIIREILLHRNIFEEQFKSEYFKILTMLNDIDELKKIPNRLLNHISLIVTSYKILSDVLNFPYDDKTLILEIIEFTKLQSDFLTEIRDVSIFWKSFNSGVERNLILEDKHYKNEIFNDLGFLYIRFNELYANYVKFCKENNYKFVDSISLRQLLTSKSNKSFIPANQSSRKNSKAHTIWMVSKSVSAYKFQYEINDNIYTINNIEINLLSKNNS